MFDGKISVKPQTTTTEPIISLFMWVFLSVEDKKQMKNKLSITLAWPFLVSLCGNVLGNATKDTKTSYSITCIKNTPYSMCIVSKNNSSFLKNIFPVIFSSISVERFQEFCLPRICGLNVTIVAYDTKRRLNLRQCFCIQRAIGCSFIVRWLIRNLRAFSFN